MDSIGCCMVLYRLLCVHGVVLAWAQVGSIPGKMSDRNRGGGGANFG